MFIPFTNESDVLNFDGLTFENRLDCVTISGSFDVTLDKPGRARLIELICILQIIDASMSEVAPNGLPDAIEVIPPTEGDSPL